jgi:hypothetical protein
MEMLWFLVIVVLLCVWWYAYFKWLQEWLWRKPKFLKNLCLAGAPVFVGWLVYMFTHKVIIGLLFAGPLLLVMSITLVCLTVEAIKGPARGKA